MDKPDTFRVAAAAAYLFVAAVCATFLPRLARLARRYPATRRGLFAWRLLVGVCLTAALTELLGAAPWATLAVHGAGLVATAVALWPQRHGIAAALRGVPPPAAAPAPEPHGNVVTSVEDARTLYGPDPPEPDGAGAGG